MTSGWCDWKPSKGNIIILKIKKVTVNILYFAPLQFSRQKWSVAPSIFNILEQGLGHCILWVKLMYVLYFYGSMALSDGRACKKYCFGNIDTITGASRREINQIKQYGGFQLIQCLPICLWMRFRLLDSSYLASKWFKMWFTVPLSWLILNKKTGRVKIIP